MEFADSLVFTADSLVKGAEVGIRNAGPAAVVITTGRVDTVRSSSGAAEPALKVAVPANVTVPAKSQATVLLRGDSAWLKAKPGRYVASLILTFAGGSLQRRMVVTRAAPPAPPVRPLVGTVKFRPRSWLPWGSFSREVQVPVLGGVRPPPAGLVGLATADGTPARAEVGSAVEWNEDSRVLAYPVRLTGLHGGRSYSGVIQLVPGDDASKATLNVDASDQVIWVLIVVALGVAAGILFRQWRDVGQPVSYLRERELRLGRRFGGALREYAAAGGKAKRLGAQLREVRRGLETELRAAGRLLTKDTAAATRFDDLQKQLDVLEAQADGIRALARAHGQLRSTAAAALQIAGPRPEGLGLDPRPRLVLAAEKALEGADVRLDSLVQQRDALASMTALLRSWGDVFHELRWQQTWLDGLRQGAATAESQQLDTAAHDLRTVRWALWDVRNAAEFEGADFNRSIATVETALREIEDQRLSRKVPEGTEDVQLESVRPTASAAREAWIAREHEVPDADLTVSQQTERADHVRYARGLTNVALAIASFIIALVTMLGTTYLNHPFGTLADYATALAWGFGTTAGLELLASGLASLQPVLVRFAGR